MARLAVGQGQRDKGKGCPPPYQLSGCGISTFWPSTSRPRSSPKYFSFRQCRTSLAWLRGRGTRTPAGGHAPTPGGGPPAPRPLPPLPGEAAARPAPRPLPPVAGNAQRGGQRLPQRRHKVAPLAGRHDAQLPVVPLEQLVLLHDLGVAAGPALKRAAVSPVARRRSPPLPAPARLSPPGPRRRRPAPAAAPAAGGRAPGGPWRPGAGRAPPHAPP